MTFGPQHQVRDVSEKLAVCDPYFDDASKGLVNNAARLEEANSTNPPRGLILPTHINQIDEFDKSYGCALNANELFQALDVNAEVHYSHTTESFVYGDRGSPTMIYSENGMHSAFNPRNTDGCGSLNSEHDSGRLVQTLYLKILSAAESMPNPGLRIRPGKSFECRVVTLGQELGCDARPMVVVLFRLQKDRSPLHSARG
jgi:hypothetical protein